jgi:parallel beta-helix repeat protein
VSQVPIFVDGNSVQVRDNSAFSAFVFDAVRLEGSQNVARGNTIFNAAESGVFLDGNNNVVRSNTITDAQCSDSRTGSISSEHRLAGVSEKVGRPAQLIR